MSADSTIGMSVMEEPRLQRTASPRFRGRPAWVAACLVWLGVAMAAPASAALPVQHWTRPNGTQVWLIESPSLPMVDVQVDFDAGGRRDPQGQGGLAYATAQMTGKGVRADGNLPALDENALSEAWADLGAGFNASAGADRLSFVLRSLTYPDVLSRVVALAARQIGSPAFPEAVWRRERERLGADLRESYTRPATLAEQAFGQAVYRDHPYANDMTEASLARIEVTDMTRHYATVLPCRAKVSIVGAVSRAQADALAAGLLAALPSGRCEPLPPVAEVLPLPAPAERRLPFASAQAHVMMGQPGYKRDDPDYFPLLVGNYILGGGGFVSRLTTEVREKRGLSYSVYSYFSPGLHAGAFTVGLQTRPEQAEQAVAVARGVVSRFVAEGPTAQELQAAKDFLVGGYALRIDSNRKLLDNLAQIAWYGLPLDYLETWPRALEKVTLADIRAAFGRKLQPDRMVTVVVGGGPAAAR